MSDSRFALEVFVFGASGFGGSLMFATPQVTIGRDPRSMVHLDDPSVSLRHAILELVDGSVRVRDLGSRAGTLVNGRSIATNEVTLQPTDELRIGICKLRLSIHRPEAGQARPAAQRAQISVPTPFEQIPVRQSPATATARTAETTSLELDEEVTVTGISLPRSSVESSPDEEASDLGATARRPAWTRAEPSLSPSTEPLAFKLPLARSTAAESPAARPAAASSASPPAAVSAATVPLAFHPAALVSSPHPQAAAAWPLAAAPPAPTAVQLSPQPVRAAPFIAQPVPFAAPPATEPRVVSDRAKILAFGSWRSTPAADDDDDEDDDADFVPPFDLLQTLMRVGTSSSGASGPVMAEAVYFRGDRVLAIRHEDRAGKLLVAGSKLGSRDSAGLFVLDAKTSGPLTVRQNGRRVPPEEVDTTRGLTLYPGTQVVVQLGQDDAILVHMVPRAPGLAPVRQTLRPMLERLKPGAASAAVHFLLLVVFGFAMLRGKNAIADDVNEGRFATINLQPIELAPPPPVPEPPAVEKALSSAIHSKHEPTMPGRANAKTVEHASEHDSHPAADEPSHSAQNILKALQGSGSSAPDVAGLPSLDALPRGRSGFRVSDAVGKGPGDALRVGVGNADSALNTKSASELGNVGKLEVKPGSGAVRARVSAVPAGVSGEGHLDRGAIQKVVNAHLYQVQGCYERQLAQNPGLAGKATFQWSINPSGGVGGVRIAQSSIPSVEVMSCIQGAIQRWSFPKPEGGSVTVTYPFAFTTFSN